jgi:DNA-binding YbaB/EbfC family protein
MAGFNKLIKQAQKMQEQLAKVQEELKDKTVEVTVGGGAVKVVATCDMQIQSIEIKPEVVDPEDVDMLQDLVLSGVNQALEQAQAEHQKQMSGITAGLGLPGMPGM